MRHFLKLTDRVDPMPALLELQQNPKLWNAQMDRTGREDSPHREADDLWVRFEDPATINSMRMGMDPHYSVWYDTAKALRTVRTLCYQLQAITQAEHLGGVLITRIPPGKRIYAHSDSGWHAEFFNLKLYCVLQSNDQCLNRTEDEIATMHAGEVWSFNNRLEHEVVNNGSDDRITLIICLRKES